MAHSELIPTAADLPNLQLTLDSLELTPNDALLLSAAGPALDDSADPVADLAGILAGETPADASTDADHPSPATALLAMVEKATPEQLRALVVYALQKSWVTEGLMEPDGGLQVSE